MTDLIVDCETDGLLDSLTRVWTIQVGDASTSEATVYADQPGYPPLSEAIERIRRARRVIMHNGLRFDFHVFNRFWPGCVRLDQVYDTMVVSRLVEPSERQHSLAAWGKRLGLHKGDHSDWSQFSTAMAEYGKQDIHVTRALYHRMDAIARLWGDSVELEFMVAYVVFLQETNGFCLNLQKAIALDAELRQEMAEIEAELQKAFPPLNIETPFIPKVNNKST